MKIGLSELETTYLSILWIGFLISDLAIAPENRKKLLMAVDLFIYFVLFMLSR